MQLASSVESNQYCLHHLTYCGCPISNYTLVYRYSTKELEKMLDKITEACKTKQTKLIPRLKDAKDHPKF